MPGWGVRGGGGSGKGDGETDRAHKGADAYIHVQQTTHPKRGVGIGGLGCRHPQLKRKEGTIMLSVVEAGLQQLGFQGCCDRGCGLDVTESQREESSTALGQQTNVTRRTFDRRILFSCRPTLRILVSVEERNCLEVDVCGQELRDVGWRRV